MSRYRFRRVALEAAVLLAVGVALAALIANEDSDSSGKADSNFARLLALVPDTPEARFDLFLIDYDQLFNSLGVSRPPSTRSSETDIELVEKLEANWRLSGNHALAFGYPGTLGALSGLDVYSRAAPTTRAFGFGVADVHGYVYAGRNPSGFEAVVGRFDKESVTHSISHCSDCGKTPKTIEYAGTEYYAWGGDFKRDLRNRLKPPLDELGVGGRLAGSSTYLLRTEWSGGIEQMLDASTGARPSLADDADMRMITRQLDALQTISAYVSYCTWTWPRVVDYQSRLIEDWIDNLSRDAGGDPTGEVRSSLRQQFGLYRQGPPPDNLLQPYQAFAVASGIRNQEPFTALILLHKTANQAQENAVRLRARLGATRSAYSRYWPDASTIDISVSGRLVVARFPRAISPDELLYSVDLLASR
jgi:hypothetical protein